MLIQIKTLTWDPTIYPRTTQSRQTIDAYAQALAVGAQFPPIKIQRVFNYADGQTATIVIDGRHRCEACTENGITEIAAIEWKEQPIDYQKNKTALLLESAQCNTRHGDRLTPGDKKQVARDIAATDRDGTYTEENLAQTLGVTRQTINLWISDSRARQRSDRTATILRLSRLGWTQEKISGKVGINQQRISQITNNANFGNIGNLLSRGHTMEYIAAHLQMDLALAWAIRLQGKTDQEKFKDLGWGLRTWDPQNDPWPVTRKPDLIFFDPPYYTKKQKAYEQRTDKEMPSISSFTKKEYTRFFKDFFTLAHKFTGPYECDIQPFCNAPPLIGYSLPLVTDRAELYPLKLTPVTTPHKRIAIHIPKAYHCNERNKLFREIRHADIDR